MKILIITKFAYPCQTPRAFRVAELSECLAKLGHEVHVYAVTGGFDYTEYSSMTGVYLHNIKSRIIFETSTGVARYNSIDKTLFHLFNKALCYPDIDLMFKTRRVIKEQSDADMLITVAIPHTIHWGAALAKKSLKDKFPKCWVSDCGDPFCLNPFINPPKYFRVLEKMWCRLTDYITVPTKSSYDGYYPEFHKKLRVIPQAFDFTKTPISEYKENSIPTFAFAGQIYSGRRDPLSFVKYLSKLDKPFKFILYTRDPIDESYKKILGDKLVNVNGLNRKECIYELSKADFLINITNPNTIQTPSKLIDYGIAGRPILNISNDFGQQDEFTQFYNRDYTKNAVHVNLSDFDINVVTQQFLDLYNSRV